MKNNIPSIAVRGVFNFLGQLTEVSTLDTGGSKTCYNSLGKLRFCQDALGSSKGYICYIKYDGLGRKVEEGIFTCDWGSKDLVTNVDNNAWPMGGKKHKEYVYDGDDDTPNMIGKLWKAISYNGSDQDVVTDEYAYDVMGNVLSKQTTTTGFDKGVPVEMRYSYDCNKKVLSAQDSESGITIRYDYDALHHLRRVYDGDDTLSCLTYNQEGILENQQILPDSKDDGKGLFERSYGYNSRSWGTSIDDMTFSEDMSYISGGCTDEKNYVNVIRGQSLNYKDNPSLSEDYCFDIDNLNRLTGCKSGDIETSWDLDENGNFLGKTQGGDVFTYAYDKDNPNRLLSYDGKGVSQKFEYNLNGSVTCIDSDKESRTYTYCDGLERVSQVEISGDANKKLANTYDTSGNRVLKSVSGDSTSQTCFFYGHSVKPDVVTDITGTKKEVKRLVCLPGIIVVLCEGKRYFGIQDHLGSVRNVVSDSGDIVGQYSYDLYGLPTIIKQSPFSFHYLYTSQCYDVELGQYHFKSRLYDPVLGRFLMVDMELQQPSVYAYGGNNPIMIVDPDGNIGVGWMIGAIIAGIAVTLVTGGVGGAILGSGLAASLGVAAVAGAAGAMASHAFIAAGNHEAYFSKSLAIDVASGVAAGVIGAGVGAAAGQVTMRAAMSAGIGVKATTAIGAVTSGVSGGVAGGLVSTGVTSLANNQPYFSGSLGVNIGVGATVGLGGGILASRASDDFGNFIPRKEAAPVLDLSIPIRSSEMNQIGSVLLQRDEGGTLIDLNGEESYFWKRDKNFVNKYHNEDIVLVHGPKTSSEVYPSIYNRAIVHRPLSFEKFAGFLRNKGIDGTNKVRLFSCYSGRRTLFYSRAQMLANELNTEVYAFPTAESPSYDGPWKMFSPRNR
jgi:RHS repeat-associated protein